MLWLILAAVALIVVAAIISEGGAGGIHVNPPNESGKRPPAPQGSGGQRDAS